jgi:hypothetical protein
MINAIAGSSVPERGRKKGMAARERGRRLDELA